MHPMPHEEAALQQLAAIPGVIGSMVFEPQGAVTVSAFPPVFEPARLCELASQLAADGYFRDWMSGDHATLDLRHADGRVLLRSLGRSWLLVLCTAQANSQLMSMSLTQVVRRLRMTGPSRPGDAPSRGPPRAPEPLPIERLRAIARAELGEDATRAIEILNAAGAVPKDLLRAAGDVEKLTRLFISKKKADEIGRRMREILGE